MFKAFDFCLPTTATKSPPGQSGSTKSSMTVSASASSATANRPAVKSDWEVANATFMIDFLIVLATLLVVGLMALMAWLAIILVAGLLGRWPDRRDKEPSGSQAKRHG